MYFLQAQEFHLGIPGTHAVCRGYSAEDVRKCTLNKLEASFSTFINLGFSVLPKSLSKTNWRHSSAAAIQGRVRDAMTLHACNRNERMNLGTFHAHDVVNLKPARSQRIRDERTVAPPGNRFRAHNCTPLLPGQFDQAVQPCCEFGGLHIISKTTK
jgi:hypothetical protein